MTRAQILLQPWQYQFLEAIAQKEHISISQLVRQWIEEKARQIADQKEKDQIWDLAGIVRDAPADMAECHDQYLYGTRPLRRPSQKK